MNEQIEEIKEWIEKADHDLGSAKIIYLHLPDYFDTIAFHCQQAVEKYIKSILIFYKVDFVKTHDLVYLLELLSHKIEIDELKFKKAFTLNNFEVQIRYPNKMARLPIVSGLRSRKSLEVKSLNSKRREKDIGLWLYSPGNPGLKLMFKKISIIK